jgi:hypothetical protein
MVEQKLDAIILSLAQLSEAMQSTATTSTGSGTPGTSKKCAGGTPTKRPRRVLPHQQLPMMAMMVDRWIHE